MFRSTVLAGFAPGTVSSSHSSGKFNRRAILAAGLAALVLLPGHVEAQTETTIEITIKDHRFEPAEVKAPAGKPIVIVIKNADASAEEFESKQLKIEKVIAGKGEGKVNIRALTPGRYKFVGEYHEDTAKGVLIVE